MKIFQYFPIFSVILTEVSTQQLRQWLMANQQAIPPYNADDILSSLGENSDLASTIMKIFGFGYDRTGISKLSKNGSPIIAPKIGVKVSERDGKYTSIFIKIYHSLDNFCLNMHHLIF